MKCPSKTMMPLIVLSFLIFALTPTRAERQPREGKIPGNNVIKIDYPLTSNVPKPGLLFSSDTLPVHTNDIAVGTCDVSNRPLVDAQLISMRMLSQPRTDFAVASAGNKILIAGGTSNSKPYISSRVDIFDVKTNSWSTAELSQARFAIATAVLGNKIFFAGGIPDANQGRSSRVDIYDVELNTWSTAELSVPTTYAAGVTIGNKVIFPSLSNANGDYYQSFNAEIYDGSMGTWSTSSLNGQSILSIAGVAATVVGTKVYFAGEASNLVYDPDYSDYSSAIYIYDIATDKWSTSNLSEARGFMASIAVADKIYWAGGWNGDRGPNSIPGTNLVEIRDVNTGLSSFDCLSRQAVFLSAVLNDNKIVYSPGSILNPGYRFDIYDVATGSWSIGVLPVNFSGSSSGISMVSVNNNIYIAGGYVNGVLSNQLWKLEIGTPSPVPVGLTYKYYEGNFNSLPDFSTLTPIKTGIASNVDINVRPAGVDDHFAFAWNGTITVPIAGTYTFETVSDDGSKLYFNGNLLVNNDGLHPSASSTGAITVPAGIYPISISYFEKDGGQSMQVYWTGPGITRQLIPDAAFASGTITPPGNNGLTYKYYEGDFNTLPDFTALTPLKTGASTNADISVRRPGVNDHFAFVWQGYISIPTSGTYSFETISDDGSKIYFNTSYTAGASSLVNNDGLHAPTSVTGTVDVSQPGTYPITITYFEKDGGQTMQLYWSGPGISRQPIPDAAFVSAPNKGLNYKYYEGSFDMLPDYNTLTPVMSGITNNVDIAVRPPGVNDYFAFKWYGYINLPVAGTYTFATSSDDGSKLYIDGNLVVNNDGLHASNPATGTVTVTSPGKYPITIEFFEKNGGESMYVFWKVPGDISHSGVSIIPDDVFSLTDGSNGNVVKSAATTNLTGVPNQYIEKPVTTKVYPNPFVESFRIDYYNSGSAKDKVSIKIYDLNGKLIYQYQPSNLLSGNNSLFISPGGNKLIPGVYMAQVKVNGIPVKTIKLIKTIR